MPIFKIAVTPNELNNLVKEHPKLISRTCIDDTMGGVNINTPPIDDDWTPIDEGVRWRYEKLKRRLSP